MVELTLPKNSKVNGKGRTYKAEKSEGGSSAPSRSIAMTLKAARTPASTPMKSM